MRRRLNGKPGKTYGERNKKYREEGPISEEMNAKRFKGRKATRNMTDKLI